MNSDQNVLRKFDTFISKSVQNLDRRETRKSTTKSEMFLPIRWITDVTEWMSPSQVTQTER